MCWRLVFWTVTFRSAVRQISGARALGTSGAAVIAGLAAAIHEAGRVRDMRKYPFWARGAVDQELFASMRPERYCAIARRLAARPKKNDEERGNEEAGVFGSKF